MLAAKLMSAMVGASGSGTYIGYIVQGDYPNYSAGSGQIIAYGANQIYLTGRLASQTYRSPTILKLTDSFDVINAQLFNTSTNFNQLNLVFDGTYFYGAGGPVETSTYWYGIVRSNETRNSMAYRSVSGSGGQAGYVQNVFGAAPTSDGGAIIVGAYNYDYYDGNYYDKPIAVKVNSSGTSVWQRRANVSQSYATRCTEVQVASNGDIYIGGNVNNGTSSVIKCDSSGALIWWYEYTYGLSGLTIDSSNNVYITTFNQTNGYLTKLNSSGGVTWTREIVRGATGLNLVGMSPVIDSSGNVYCMFTHPSAPSYPREQLILVKFNSSGDLQWQKVIRQETGTNGKLFAPVGNRRLSIKGDMLYWSALWQPDTSFFHVIFGSMKLDGTTNGSASLNSHSIVIEPSNYTIQSATRSIVRTPSAGDWEGVSFAIGAGSAATTSDAPSLTKVEL